MRGENKISFPVRWNSAGSITSETAELAVTGRDVATVDALASTKVIKLSPPLPGPFAMLLRFRADDAADLDSVLELYAARMNDHYYRVATLTVVTGTQDTATSTIHFVDTITPSNEDALFDGEESNLANMIGHYYMRVMGCDRFAIIASDLDSTTVYCDVAWLYE